MRYALLSLVLGMLMVPVGVDASSKGEAWTKWIHREGNTPLNQLVQDEVRAAKKVGKTIVIMFTADWCAPCKALKEMIHGSKVVQKATKKGRFLYIDVDEWRGPAHRLFPGVNPQKLPTLVSLDPKGTKLLSVRGTDLGLLSEEDTGKNLKRLIAGLSPQEASYSKDSTKRTELIRASAKKSRELTKDWEPVTVTVNGKKPKKGQWADLTVNVSIRNKDSRRKWMVIGVPGQPLAEAPQLESWTIKRFNEHVRAYMVEYVGYPSFTVLPVAGGGGLDLNQWPVRVGPGADALEIWELKQFNVDGQKRQFDKKVPYMFKVENAGDTTVFSSEEGQPQLDLLPSKKHLIPIL